MRQLAKQGKGFTMEQADRKYSEELAFFRAEMLKANENSAYALVFRDMEKTLADDEVNAAMKKIKETITIENAEKRILLRPLYLCSSFFKFLSRSALKSVATSCLLSICFIPTISV